MPGDVCMLASYFCVRLYLYLLLHCANNILKIEPHTHFEDRTTHSKRFVVMNAGIWTVYLSNLSWWWIEILRVNTFSFLVMVIFIHQIFWIPVSAIVLIVQDHLFPLVSLMKRFHQRMPFGVEVKYQQRCWWVSHLPSQWNARCSSACPAPSGLEQGWGWVRSHSLDLQWSDRAQSLSGRRQLSVNSLSHAQHMLYLGLCCKLAVCNCYFDEATNTLLIEVVT